MSGWTGQGRVQVRTEWCKGCGICVAICPRQVLAQDEYGKVQVTDDGACTGCRMCETHCPDFALVIDMERANAGNSGVDEAQ